MNRIQKKCFILSTSLHGLLVFILLFGSALMPQREEENNSKLRLNIISADTVSMLLNTTGGNGGENAIKDNPNPTVPAAVANPPQAAQVEKPEQAPVAPVPKPPVTLAKPAEPRHEPPPTPPVHRETVHNNSKPPVDVPKPHNNTIKPTRAVVEPPSPPKVVIDPKDLKRTTREGSDAQAKKQAQEAADAAAAQSAAAARAEKQRRKNLIAGTLRNLNNGLSPNSLVKTDIGGGPGGGGSVSVNYTAVIFNKYYNAWVAPVALGDDTPVVTVRITISRDGNVIASNIIRRSGNTLMDRSVEKTLENVTYILPFPDGSTEREKTVTIEFNLEAKRQTG